MTSERRIRRAAPGDERLLRDLRLRALADAPEAFGSTYDRELARTAADWQRWLSTGVTLVLEDAGTAAGLVAGMADPDDSGIVYLMAMWVEPARRGSGAGDALVAELLAWARTVGARTVRLDVISTNAPARRLYQRHGFRPTGRQSVRQRDGRIELQMERSALDPIPHPGDRFMPESTSDGRMPRRAGHWTSEQQRS